jgi:hypothetical protein
MEEDRRGDEQEIAVVIIGELCPGCQKFRSPLAMIDHGGYRQCVECEHRHEEALDSLATGRPPRECSECGRTWDQIREGEQQAKMICHMEAGLYRFMCARCDRVYVPLRRELYGPTEFGRLLKLS